jgi:hypothetical protein
VNARLRPPRRPLADARLRADARARDGGVRQELAAGVRHVSFRGNLDMREQPAPMASDANDPERSSGAFTRLAYRPLVTDWAMETWYNPSVA